MGTLANMLADFKNFVANCAAFIAAAGATIGSVDYFLSKSQKAFIERSNLHIWFWLSNKRPSIALEKYRNENYFKTLVFYGPIGLGISSIILSPVLGPNALPQGISYVLLGVLNLFVTKQIFKIEYIYKNSYGLYSYILKTDNALILFLLSLIIQIVWFIIWFCLVVILFYTIGQIVNEDLFALGVLFVAAFVIPAFTSFLAVCALTLNFFNIFILTCIYYVSEWFVRKAAESDKGVVLGASAALGAISTFLKGFV